MGLSITPFPTASAREFSGYTTTVTSATPIDLTSASAFVQRFTGSTSQTIRMPVTTTISAKFSFLFVNDSIGALTLATSNGSFINNIGVGAYALVICILASGTTAASWKFIPIPLIDTDGTLAANSDLYVPSQMAVVTYVGLRLTDFLFTAPLVRYSYFNVDDSTSSHTNGTEDELRSYDIGTGLSLSFLQGGMLSNPGDTIIQEEVLVTIGSATASRRIKKYLNDSNTNLIWDSGSLTLSLGTRFHIRTTIMRIDETSVRVDVAVTTTSASTVPYVTYTEILTLDGLTTASEFLRTTAIASGVGAAAGDIISVMSHVEKVFGPP